MTENKTEQDDDLRPEYDLKELLHGAKRGKYAAEFARARRDAYARICRAFEERYAIDSDEFMQRFEACELGDAADYFDWFAARRGLDVWEHKLRILSSRVVGA